MHMITVSLLSPSDLISTNLSPKLCSAGCHNITFKINKCLSQMRNHHNQRNTESREKSQINLLIPLRLKAFNSSACFIESREIFNE